MGFSEFPEITVIIEKKGTSYEKEEKIGEAMIKKTVEPDGTFDIRNGVAEIFRGKGGSGFYEIIWDMGKFLLASGEGYETMKKNLDEYVSHGRRKYEKTARKENPSRPEWISPDDSRWLVEYLGKNGIKSGIICPKANVIKTYSVLE